MSDEIQRIDIAEFRALGFLQEANRQFFHPLGLALEVDVDDEGNERLSGVWDYRDDPEGIIFAAGSLDRDKVEHVARERLRHAEPRRVLIGAVIQEPDP